MKVFETWLSSLNVFKNACVYFDVYFDGTVVTLTPGSLQGGYRLGQGGNSILLVECEKMQALRIFIVLKDFHDGILLWQFCDNILIKVLENWQFMIIIIILLINKILRYMPPFTVRFTTISSLNSVLRFCNNLLKQLVVIESNFLNTSLFSFPRFDSGMYLISWNNNNGVNNNCLISDLQIRLQWHK